MSWLVIFSFLYVVSLYHPLKSNEPFFLLSVLFFELINVGVFSYPLYLSTLIARGEVTAPIVPQLPFFRGENESPPPSPMESDTEEQLSLKVSLPIVPGLIIANRSSPDKPRIKKENVGTLSPSLPDRFGSQDILLDPFDSINGSLMSSHNIKVKAKPFYCNNYVIICFIFRTRTAPQYLKNEKRSYVI